MPIEKDGILFNDSPRISLPAYSCETPHTKVVRYQSIPVIEMWVYFENMWYIFDKAV